VSSTLRIGRRDLDQLTTALLSRYRLYGPVDSDSSADAAPTGGFSPIRTVTICEVRSAERLRFEPGPATGSAKAAFFPQTETLLAGPAAEPVGDLQMGVERPTAVLGIRPCDAKGLLLLDRVFGSGRFEDARWLRRYRDGLVITLGCGERLDSCFCEQMDGGPFNPAGSDIMLTDIGDAFIAETCTDKGERFLKLAYKTDLQRPSEDDLAKAGQVRSRMPKAAGRKFTVGDLPSQDSPAWDRAAFGCLACAACAYLCPTCHCFDIQDERRPGTEEGRRVRIWDTCMSALFTKEASGHNPRRASRDRMRQRVMHKFDYFVENFGEPACTGCGRCVRYCPAGLDIRLLVEQLAGDGRAEPEGKAQ
jgi:ferredoxin